MVEVVLSTVTCAAVGIEAIREQISKQLDWIKAINIGLVTEEFLEYVGKIKTYYK